MADWIYFDNHTKTRPAKALIDQMAKGASDHWLVSPDEKALSEVFELLGASGYHLSVASDPHFTVLYSHYMNFVRKTGRTHILALESEQETILSGIKELEKFEVQGKILPVSDRGHLTGMALAEVLRARSGLFSFSWAHPYTGVIQPIHDLVAECKRHEVQVHVDLSAAIGKLHFQLLDFDADYYTFDGAYLRMPVPCKFVLSKEKIASNPVDVLPVLASALRMSLGNIDTYAMEVGGLRTLFESKLQGAGAQIHHQDVERLPNTILATFEGIHGEQITDELRRAGVFARAGRGLSPSAVSFVLSEETTEQEVVRAAEAVEAVIHKIRSKKRVFSTEDAKTKNMRVCNASVSSEIAVSISLLIDEEDGVIADAAFDVFGPPSFQIAAETTCSRLLRKNYLQARRLSADLIEKELSKGSVSDKELNLLIDVIDAATERCIDIPIEDIYVAPPEMGEGERTVYPNWESLSNEQKKKIIAEVIERDIRPYVELDAGGVEVVKVEDNRVTIAYSGNCTSCFSSTGATLDAIGNILRHKIFPDLMVTPDVSLLQT